jgi:ankyrin repeat protein
MAKILLIALFAQTLFAQTEAEVRQAVARALPLLESSAATFVAKRACVSCHHNILPVLAFHLARQRGVAINTKVLDAVEDKTLRALRGPAALDDAVQATGLADPTPNDSFLLMAAHAAGLPASAATAVYASRLLNWQRGGHWVTSDFRPPHSSSAFTATATAVRAIDFYLPVEFRAKRNACLLRARRWLVATHPLSTEDASFRLMGLVWAGGSSGEIAAAKRDLLARRMDAGGWPELPAYPPDAYSTGEALYALHEAGVPSTDPVSSAGLEFLISTQAPDGTWRVRTRMISPAPVSPEYFPSGFPYGKDEYLSYAGSSWAVMAMLSSLPIAKERDVISHEEDPTPPWIRTTLFGSSKELAGLLDTGLDPNSRTERGTTLLMMAAPDAEKARLLLSRGAKVTAKAVIIAASWRGTSASVRLLLERNADADTSKALERASLSGDLENIKLLLKNGAEPSAGLSQAVTFGHSDLVRTLITAGANAKMTESTGINLLHWATIANRPKVIPVLAEAGVPINAMDEFHYTPLMYAATIDFGDARVLKALLKAGADPKIRNDEGRTALEQARYYRHALLEKALQ